MKTLKLIAILTLVLVNLSIAQNWQVVYKTDFSADPDWTTNNSTYHYWDQSSETYYVDQINISYGGYYAYHYVGYNNEAFKLEWDFIVNGSSGASGLNFGLSNSNLDIDSDVYVRLILGDNRRSYLNWWDENGYGSHEFTDLWEYETWYHAKLVYNNNDNTLTITVLNINTQAILYSYSESNVGPFDPDMNLLTTTNYRPNNDFAVPGAHTWGRFDNIYYSLDVLCQPLFTITGTEYDELGASISKAGDFNNDGYDDIIAGAPGVLSEAYIYSGIDGSLLYKFQGENVNDRFGCSVSNAGDINSDGYDDVIIGAPLNELSGIKSGRAYVFFGRSSFPSVISASNAEIILTGEAANDYFGSSVSSAGDVNGDGYDDVVVGAPENDAGGNIAGRVYVFLGSSGPFPKSMTATDAYHILTGLEPDLHFGYPVDGIGDIDLDGYEDFIVGAEGYDASGTNNGAAWIISGLTGNVIYSFFGENSNDRLGIGASGAGDVNGDGWPDVVVGADLYNEWTGKVYVYSGIDGSLLFDITGEASGDRFGHFVSDAGDINGDGFDDILISSYLNDVGGHYAGRVYVVLGRSGSYPAILNASNADFIFTGEEAGDRFGWSIACAGDLNNDNNDEIVIGAVDENLSGSTVYVFDINLCHYQPIDSDNYIYFPSISVKPCDSDTLFLQPVSCYLAQPASGATITIDIPQDIEIYGISYDNLITESWNTKYEVIKEDSNYLLILLLDTTGKRIPADTTTLFFIQYYAVSPCNFDYFIHWDTALSDDPSRSTRFSDTLSTTFYPVFDYYKDTTKIIGYTPGDANNSGGEPDISDITFVIAYLYLGGPGPCIINALDANGSCGSAPDISDITKLISYLYLGGLEPECGCIGEETVAYKANLGKMAVNSGYENDYTIISLITDQNISGLHLELSGIGSDIPEKVLQDDIEMFYGIDGNTIKIGLFDIEGQKLITSGSQPVIKLEGEYEIIKAVASTKTYQSVALAINPKVEDNNLPTDFTLYQNFPNPFNPTTEICFDLPNACNVKLEIFNIMGQKVTTLIDQGLDAGHHTVQWDAGNNASGIYLYKITAGDFVETKKMVLLK